MSVGPGTWKLASEHAAPQAVDASGLALVTEAPAALAAPMPSIAVTATPAATA